MFTPTLSDREPNYGNFLICKLINSIPSLTTNFSVKLVLTQCLNSIEFLQIFPEVIFHDTRFIPFMIRFIWFSIAEGVEYAN